MRRLQLGLTLGLATLALQFDAQGNDDAPEVKVENAYLLRVEMTQDSIDGNIFRPTQSTLPTKIHYTTSPLNSSQAPSNNKPSVVYLESQYIGLNAPLVHDLIQQNMLLKKPVTFTSVDQHLTSVDAWYDESEKKQHYQTASPDFYFPWDQDKQRVNQIDRATISRVRAYFDKNEKVWIAYIALKCTHEKMVSRIGIFVFCSHFIPGSPPIVIAGGGKAAVAPGTASSRAWAPFRTVPLSFMLSAANMQKPVQLTLTKASGDISDIVDFAILP